MAYETYQSATGAPAFLHPEDDGSMSPRNTLGNMTNISGAIVSVALVVGIGLWGYKLMVRDVTGIPVVRAMQGDMREIPEDPGGELALNQGLAVNTVAAIGNAEAPADRLILAPQPVQLTEEDQPLDDEAVAIVQQAIEAQNVVEVAARAPESTNSAFQGGPEATQAIQSAAASGDVEKLVEELTRGVEPLAHKPGEIAEVTPEAPVVAAVVRSETALRVSKRPQLRPTRAVANDVAADVTRAVAAAQQSQSTTPSEVDASSLPAGTRLVQLGAYDKADVARAEWDKFSIRFEDLMGDKARVVQQAKSGGRSFYRLRVAGFDDLSDARRFCSALVAEGADCIPVVTR